MKTIMFLLGMAAGMAVTQITDAVVESQMKMRADIAATQAEVVKIEQFLQAITAAAR
jgi:hypothetical protein